MIYRCNYSHLRQARNERETTEALLNSFHHFPEASQVITRLYESISSYLQMLYHTLNFITLRLLHSYTINCACIN